METSEEINEIATALAKAQGDIGGAVKDSENPFFKSKYADLGSVWAVARKPLSENGIAVVQTPENTESGVTLKTTMFHSSGQWISFVFDMPVQKKDAQGYGSAISYARRYTLASMIGVYTEDDDAEGQKEPYEVVENAIENVKKTIDLVHLEKTCGIYSKDYKSMKTGWTGKSWNSLCSVMKQKKEELEEIFARQFDENSDQKIDEIEPSVQTQQQTKKADF